MRSHLYLMLLGISYGFILKLMAVPIIYTLPPSYWPFGFFWLLVAWGTAFIVSIVMQPSAEVIRSMEVETALINAKRARY